LKKILLISLLISSFSFSQKKPRKAKKDTTRLISKEIQNFKNAAGISLDEVIVIEDSLISVSINRNGNEYIFNPKEFDDFQIDSIRQSLQWQKIGLNEYGINTKAFNLIEGIRRRLTGVQIADPSTGLIRLRSSASINNSKTIPAFVVDNQIYVIPDELVEDAIQRGVPLWSLYPPVQLDDIIDVEVLRSLAETTKYGLLGNAGVIKITTKNSRKPNKIKYRKKSTESKPTYFDSPFLISPIFPGCEKSNNKKECFNKSIDNYMKLNIKYPYKINEKIISRVYVQIYIDKFGNISKYKARISEGEEAFAEEALRVVKKLPKFIPAKFDNKNIGVYYSFLTLFKPE